MIPVFDGHNDILFRLMHAPEAREAIWLGAEAGAERGGGAAGHLDLPRMIAGGFAAGFFAVYLPSPHDPAADLDAAMDNPPYALPLPEALPLGPSQALALEAVGHLMWMERASAGRFRLVRSVPEIEAARAAGAIAGILHMEGAEAIDPACEALHVWHAAGLRSLGPVWSRPTAFGHGVPFAFPAGPDTGPGLTDAGKRLVATCNALKIMLDLSHLNLKGMEDVARLSDAPLVATHSNAHSVCPSSRNLTDAQLGLIRASQGMVGLNFATVFLRPDGRRDPSCGYDPMLRHLDHLIDRLGEDHVGFGSDFDGAMVPEVIGDVTGLPGLLQALRDHGFGEGLIRKLAFDNWLAVLRRSWQS